MPALYVAIYYPRYGNYQHWALHLHTTNKDLIYEVDGEHPSFRKVTSRGKPSDSDSLIMSLLVSEIGDPDVPTVQEAVEAAHVDNETLEWDCQEYVLEILAACEQEAVLDTDDEHYVEVMKFLKSKRGPTL
ncbi:hypothetical protein BDV38DRAFT_252672 [Aspergillus pseudotamarii]|uniref:Uncharacterized protein n=1 Tax=Aspergillus pseudotamarii TaxID=132259 RepID=A0A5N6SNL3_ASPPS|nr:uncharacterized protein BDV38DRAFT_252672 [Aspergillus pseudotamarii]KAE8135360.1 hypothetical protein BDV38DRAFT_252672 [Aspergillus pseudotamarii]